MPAFFLSFLASALVMFAGREAVRIARLSGALGEPFLVAAMGSLAGIAVCAFAAWAAGPIGAILTSTSKLLFVAVALALAAFETLFRRAPAAPNEPTRSFAAISIVLVVGLATGPLGLLVIALGIATAAPILAGAGAALACVVVLIAAALTGRQWDQLPLGMLRAGVTGALGIAAFVIALFALNIIG